MYSWKLVRYEISKSQMTALRYSHIRKWIVWRKNKNRIQKCVSPGYAALEYIVYGILRIANCIISACWSCFLLPTILRPWTHMNSLQDSIQKWDCPTCRIRPLTYNHITFIRARGSLKNVGENRSEVEKVPRCNDMKTNDHIHRC